MKISTFISTLALTLLMLIPFNSNAQEFPDLDKSPMDAAAFPSKNDEPKKLIKIIYSRPQLKGRSIWDLAPVGKVWRTGANEAAELTIYTPMLFGDTKIEPGTYTFFMIPGKQEWTAIISKDLNVWGSYFYNEENDVAKVAVPVKNDKNNSIEAFSIVFQETSKGTDMYLGWGHIRLAIPFHKL
ncbi:DUF2911 domain-containing protein [Psychroserpens mesophilus]|uniref:DUF2911 domain-containing protein n=1 Tax=Psychroserpens mesophilus TaxID=325473 RepID=UPI003F4998A8